MAAALRLDERPVHLGLGAAAEIEPAFPSGEAAMQWYMDYAARHAADGAEGRLVSLHSFSESWDAWEMHPAGAEVVVCVEGRIELVQELEDGSHGQIRLSPGEYAINPAGTWHTANVEGAATALFITAGMGTQHRPR